MTEIQRALETGLKHQQAGDLDAAKRLYEQVLAGAPNHPDALHLLGLVAIQQGDRTRAIELIHRAVDQRPDFAPFRINLGNVLAEKHELSAAVEQYQAALRLDPAVPEVHNNLANALTRLGQRAEAVESYRRAIQLRPEYAEPYANASAVLADLGRLDEAEQAARSALRLRAQSPEFHARLAGVLLRRKQYQEALAACEKAIGYSRHPRSAAIAYQMLGDVLSRIERSADAITAYRAAISNNPDTAEARCSAAGLLRNQGCIEEAIKLYREAIALRPTMSACHSNLVLALHSVASIGPDDLLKEHVRWAEQHARPHGPIAPHPNDRSPERRLRIGYVSGDFREHSVTRFFLPVLESFDKSQLEIFCYSTLPDSDAITARVKAAADHFRDVGHLGNEQLASAIRADQIDILVDLAGHTRANRLVMFGRHKPAPVQVTWIGWLGTTGLAQIDYCITDALADPPGDESHHAERLYRIGVPYLCYGPHEDAPPVTDPPALRNGCITFGSFNNPAKFSPEVMTAWGRILTAAAGSRLLIKAVHLADPQVRQDVRALLVEHGVPADRIELLGPQAATAGHLAAYGSVDIGLDTYPFGGATTTAEALWMGVPVVTWAGRTHVSRIGLSMLDSIGLRELVARDAEEYVSIATTLALDIDRVRDLRASIRARMLRGRITDAHAAAREMEAAYRTMWRRWCAT